MNQKNIGILALIAFGIFFSIQYQGNPVTQIGILIGSIILVLIAFYQRKLQTSFVLENKTQDTLSQNTLTIISNDNFNIRDISIAIMARNDESDWINWFFNDYSWAYGTVQQSIGKDISLIRDIPYYLDYTIETLEHFTLENIQRYVTDCEKNPAFAFKDDIEIFKKSFSDPNWEAIIYINWTNIGTVSIKKDNQEIINYIQNLYS